MKLNDIYPIIYDDCRIRILNHKTDIVGEFGAKHEIPLLWLDYEVLTLLPTNLPEDNGLMIVLDMNETEGAIS